MTERMDHDPFRATGSSPTEGSEPPGLLPGSPCPPPHRYWHAAFTTGAEALTSDERHHLSTCDRCRDHLAQLTRAVDFPCPEEAAALEEELFGQDDQTSGAALVCHEDTAEAFPPPGRPHLFCPLDTVAGNTVPERKFFFEHELTALLQLRDGRHWLRLEQPGLPLGTPLLISLTSGWGETSQGWLRVVLLHIGPGEACAQLQVEEALRVAPGEHALAVQTLAPEHALASDTLALWRASFAQVCADDPAALAVWQSWAGEQWKQTSEPEVCNWLKEVISRTPVSNVATPAARVPSSFPVLSARVLNAVRRVAALRSRWRGSGGGSHRGG